MKKTTIIAVILIGALILAGGGVFAARALALSGAVGREAALNFACIDAGVSPDEALAREIEFKYKGGAFVYEVEFTAGGVKYEYLIDSKTGAVIAKSAENRDPGLNVSDAMPDYGAAAIALEDAGYLPAESDGRGLTTAVIGENGNLAVHFLKNKLEREDNALIYELNFVVMSRGYYEYEVNALSGVIREKSFTPAADIISPEKARDAAFNAAGREFGPGYLSEIELDREGGRLVYKIALAVPAVEGWKVRVDAVTGEAVIEDSWTAATPGPVATTTTTAGTKAPYIGYDEAIAIALENWGFTREQAEGLTIGLDRNDNGLLYYEVEFYAGDREYDTEINAVTGELLKASSDIRGVTRTTTPTQTTTTRGDAPTTTTTRKTVPTTTAQGGELTVSDARAIALTHAGVSESEAVFTKAKREFDDGVWIFDVEFIARGTEFEYEIYAATGAIREWSAEPVNHTYTGTTTSVPTTTTTRKTVPTTTVQDNNGRISVEDARAIALQRAGLTASQVTFTKTKLERDDGIWIYDVEFISNGMEYELEIDAVTGDVLEYSVEPIDD